MCSSVRSGQFNRAGEPVRTINDRFINNLLITALLITVLRVSSFPTGFIGVLSRKLPEINRKVDKLPEKLIKDRKVDRGAASSRSRGR